MGSGKTTIAHRLAEYYGIGVQDTDELIENQYDKQIKQIFAEDGEDIFRQYEHNILIKTKTENYIVATGGGVIEKKSNRLWLKGKQVIYLKTSWGEIEKRLKGDQNRPLWLDERLNKQQLLADRERKYFETAQHVIKTDQKSIDQIIKEITDVIKEG